MHKRKVGRKTMIAGAALLGVGALLIQYAPLASASNASTVSSTSLPAIRHVFVIMLENNDYSATFGSPTKDPYLATTLAEQGCAAQELLRHRALLQRQLRRVHLRSATQHRQPGWTASASGYSNFPPGDGQIAGIQQGAGCVFPSAVTTLTSQLTCKGVHLEGLRGGHGQRSHP